MEASGDDAVEALCRAYSKVPAEALRDEVALRLREAEAGGDASAAGWLAALLGCLHYDLGDGAAAESARAAALRHALAAGDGEVAGWAHELAAWFALVEGRYAEAAGHARAGRQVAGVSSAGVQLALQEAKARARLGDRAGAEAALRAGEELLARVPPARHLDNHFVFDPSKWDFFAAAVHLQLGDDDRAEELLVAGIARHRRADGSTDAPMRTAGAQLDLALVEARRGRLDEALAYAEAAFSHARSSLGELRARSSDLLAVLAERFPGEAEVVAFEARLRRLPT